MKKKRFIPLFMLIVSLPFFSQAQNLVTNGDLELWTDSNTPEGWDLVENISQESINIHGGSYSAAHLSESSSMKFRQDISGIVGGQQYTISYYYLDNTDEAKTRIWSYWMDADGTYLNNEDDDVLRPADYSENSQDWQLFDELITAPSNAVQIRFEVRVYNQDGNIGGSVYYDDFLLEAYVTNYPEPTNYPTDFNAESSGLEIEVSWTDAAGEQLPGAYLLLGRKGTGGDFDLPEDGTPVPDDLDWGDGQVAVNVDYGLETFTFGELEGGQDYEFTIFPYTNAGANIDYKTDGTPPYATETTGSVVIINAEDFEDGTLGTWSEYNVEGPQIWENYEYQGDLFARISGYEGGAIVNEDWLLSPQMDLIGYTSIKLDFISARNYAGPDLQLFLSQDYDGESDPNGFDWLELTDQADWSPGNWEWTASGSVDLTLFAAQSCYLGFKYTSNSDEAAAWEIDNILVYGESGLGISGYPARQLLVYPNPSSGMCSFVSETSGLLIISDLAGQRRLVREVVNGENRLNVSALSPGMYFLRLIGNDGKIGGAKLLLK